jgi:Ca2+-binding EF-hand superfamily protein
MIPVEELIESLDELDKNIDKIWIEEAEKILHTYRKGRII